MLESNIPFTASDILIPDCNLEKWSCIACDQHTSSPEYWDEVKEYVKNDYSTLNIMLPEVYLTGDDGDAEKKINDTMAKYLNDNIFKEYKNSMILVERTMNSGLIRYGLVGQVDLEQYDYKKGSKTPIRATEGTVISRIPPRVEIRKNAPLELPHILMFLNDKSEAVIEPLTNMDLPILYDFDLMMGGGHITGKLITGEILDTVYTKLQSLIDNKEKDESIIAIGDGNHSLAAAKECYIQNPIPTNRYALVELVNINEKAIEFEPIYRVLFNCDTDDFISTLKDLEPGKYNVTYYTNEEEGEFSISGYAFDVLQKHIERYIETHPEVVCDYIHGKENAIAMSKRNDAIAFIYDGIAKEELFDYINKNGPLPKKAFSMGESNEKRYYLESRIINK